MKTYRQLEGNDLERLAHRGDDQLLLALHVARNLLKTSKHNS